MKRFEKKRINKNPITRNEKFVCVLKKKAHWIFLYTFLSLGLEVVVIIAQDGGAHPRLISVIERSN